MADVVLPVSNSQQPQTADALNATLDDLWSQYLSLLDRYQDLRQQLADNISTGCLNIAKANFSNPNRVRYGRDYYDERMQASTCVFGTEEELFRTVTSMPTSEASSLEALKETDDVPKEGSADAAKEEGTPKTQNRLSNPLNWFGIFIPPALKTSQVAFQGAIPKVSGLASLDMEMEKLEVEIRRTRKKLKKLE